MNHSTAEGVEGMEVRHQERERREGGGGGRSGQASFNNKHGRVAWRPNNVGTRELLQRQFKSCYLMGTVLLYYYTALYSRVVDCTGCLLCNRQ